MQKFQTTTNEIRREAPLRELSVRIPGRVFDEFEKAAKDGDLAEILSDLLTAYAKTTSEDYMLD